MLTFSLFVLTAAAGQSNMGRKPGSGCLALEKAKVPLPLTVSGADVRSCNDSEQKFSTDTTPSLMRAAIFFGPSSRCVERKSTHMNTNKNGVGGGGTAPTRNTEAPDGTLPQVGDARHPAGPDTASQGSSRKELLFLQTPGKHESFGDFKARVIATLIKKGILREEEQEGRP